VLKLRVIGFDFVPSPKVQSTSIGTEPEVAAAVGQLPAVVVLSAEAHKLLLVVEQFDPRRAKRGLYFGHPSRQFETLTATAAYTDGTTL